MTKLKPLLPPMMDQTKSLLVDKKAIKIALISILFWATVATAFKIALRSLRPEQIIFIASLVTLFLLFSIAMYKNEVCNLFIVTKRQLLLSAITGFLNPFLYYLIIFKSYSLLPAQIAQPLNMVWPLVLVLLSIPFLKHKIGWRSILAILICFIGIVITSSQGNFRSVGTSNPLGVALALGSSIVWSFYWIINVRDKRDEIIKLFWSFLFGIIYLVIFIFHYSSFRFSFDGSFYAAIYIGLFEVGISFILWMKAISMVSNSAKIANLIYIAPAISLFLIHFILKEEIHFTTIIGLFFIVSGILYQQTEKQKRSK